MTVTATDPYIAYAGDGSTVAFSVPFQFVSVGDVKAILRVDATGVETAWTSDDYSVVAGGFYGTLTADTAPATGETLFIYRDTPKTETTDFTSGDPFLAATVNSALDKKILIDQEAEAADLRAMLVPRSETDDFSGALPSAIDRADKILGFDEDGNPALYESSADYVPALDTPIEITATTLTLSTVHKGKDLVFTNASGCAVTVPGTLPDTFGCSLIRDSGAGSITITAGSGATKLVNPPSHTQSDVAGSLMGIRVFRATGSTCTFLLYGGTAP